MTGKKITGKICYRITFLLESSLSVGSGESRYTDHDIIRDSLGEPYIPASAIAGVCRSLFLKNGELPDDLKPYFGHVDINQSADPEQNKPKDKQSANTEATEPQERKKLKQIESALIFYDARMLPESKGNYFTSVRDSVKLDEHKTAVKGAKFDMEILEPGIRFRTYLEQSFYNERACDYAACIVEKIASGRAYFGEKNTRGYGKIKLELAERKIFDLTRAEGVDQWIGFDMYDTSQKQNWDLYEAKKVSGTDLHTLSLTLKQRGGISIRKYSTRVSTKEETKPDYSQLTLHMPKDDVHENTEILPVIPGTTWAGAIRQRMHELGLTTQDEELLFGFVEIEKDKGKEKDNDKKDKDKAKDNDKKMVKQKSAVRFGESQIHGAYSKILSRNAIDRFSGGTVDGALFTEETYYGGTTELEISCDDVSRMSSHAADLLAASLADLHYGFLAIGGETSIGRGLFEVESIGEKKLTAGEKEDIYPVLKKAIQVLYSNVSEVNI